MNLFNKFYTRILASRLWPVDTINPIEFCRLAKPPTVESRRLAKPPTFDFRRLAKPPTVEFRRLAKPPTV